MKGLIGVLQDAGNDPLLTPHSLLAFDCQNKSLYENSYPPLSLLSASAIIDSSSPYLRSGTRPSQLQAHVSIAELKTYAGTFLVALPFQSTSLPITIPAVALSTSSSAS